MMTKDFKYPEEVLEFACNRNLLEYLRVSEESPCETKCAPEDKAEVESPCEPEVHTPDLVKLIDLGKYKTVVLQFDGASVSLSVNPENNRLTVTATCGFELLASEDLLLSAKKDVCVFGGTGIHADVLVESPGAISINSKKAKQIKLKPSKYQSRGLE
jgi:hypothetical protein